MNSKGRKTYVAARCPGSEMRWVDDADLELDYIRSDHLPASLERWALEYFRYMVMPPAEGPNWKLTDFDFDQDYKRFGTGVQESLL